MVKIEKMTEAEAMEAVKSRHIRLENAGDLVRQCSSCNGWVALCDFYGEVEIIENGKKRTEYDICEDCKDRLEKGEEIDICLEEPYEEDDEDETDSEFEP